MSSEPTDISPLPEKRGLPPIVIVGAIIGAGVCFLACSGVLVALLLPAVQAAREAARRNHCTSNAKQIALALMVYHDRYRAFPPAYLADENGQPMHSWRVLILPFLERNDLYKAYHFDEPWDSPANQRVAQQMPDVYHCPSSHDEPNVTNYLAVVGDETLWPGARNTRMRNVKDGPSTTIAFVETAGSGIPWTAPRDLSMDEALQGVNPGAAPSVSSQHGGGVVGAAFCDGHIAYLTPETTSPEQLRAMLTIGGSEEVQPAF